MAEGESLIAATTVAVATELAKDIYNDVAHPALSVTGNVLAIIPQAIERALLPVQQWVAEGQYKLAETKKILALKLENVAPERIVPPESYIAVPALQAISYSMDNEEIRDMFANLLASSMIIDKKTDVHPAFIEIVKQINPDEAKILKYIYQKKILHVIDVEQRIANADISGFVRWTENYSLLTKKIDNLDAPLKIPEYYDNLCRLNLLAIDHSPIIKDYDFHKGIVQDFLKQHELSILSDSNVKRKQISLNVFGNAFCKICISDSCTNSEVSL